MNRVASWLLAICPAWALACNVYDASMFAGGSGGTSNTPTGGSSASGQGGSGSTVGSGATSGSGASGARGGSDVGGGGQSGNGAGSGSAGGDAGAGNAGGSSGNGGAGTGGSEGGSSGSSGGSGSAGTGGSGPPPTLLDDFEDGNTMGKVYPTNRNPIWFLESDETAGGTLVPATIQVTAMPEEDAEARPDNAYALSVSATGFTTWGAVAGIDFKSPKALYDLSPYTGITFWAKATSTYKTIRVNVADANSDESQGVCTVCSDHFGQDLPLTAAWKQYTLLFAELAPEGWGKPEQAALDLKQTLGVLFLVKGDTDVDFWVDDLELILPE